MSVNASNKGCKITIHWYVLPRQLSRSSILHARAGLVRSQHYASTSCRYLKSRRNRTPSTRSPLVVRLDVDPHLHLVAVTYLHQQTQHANKHRLNDSRTQRIAWLLEELKLDYDIKVYKRLESGQAPKELKQIHPLGKLPVLEIEAPGLDKPLLLVESGTIVEYLADHFGTWLIPKRYPDGKDGHVGAETEAWMRYRVSSYNF
jgi:hypothetical protein